MSRLTTMITSEKAIQKSMIRPRLSVHLDRGYDSNITRQRLEERGMVPEISKKGKPTPLTATKRWVVERTNSWHNAHKKLVWCTLICSGNSPSVSKASKVSAKCGEVVAVGRGGHDPQRDAVAVDDRRAFGA